jgi:ABC-type Mn2+/Zn2+ transport system permease subunit
VLVGLWLLHDRLLLVGFDRASARVLGTSPRWVDAALLVLLALAVLVAVQGLGSLLMVAVLVGPAATARLFLSRMGPMLALAAVLAVLTGGGGLYLSYYASTAAGASIAGIVVAVYLVGAVLATARERAVRTARG